MIPVLFIGGGGCDSAPHVFQIGLETCFCYNGGVFNNRSGRSCSGVGIVRMRFGAMRQLLACSNLVLRRARTHQLQWHP